MQPLEQLIPEMMAVYTRTESFNLSGRVHSQFIRPGSTHGLDVFYDFNIRRVRPSYLQIEMREVDAKGCQRNGVRIWAKGPDFKVVRQPTRPLAHTPQTLQEALVYCREIAPVLGLVMPESPEELWLSELVDVSLLESDVINGTACYRLQARNRSWGQGSASESEEMLDVLGQLSKSITGELEADESVQRSPYILWIDAQSLLLRRLEERNQTDRMQTITVINIDQMLGDLTQEDECSSMS